MESTFTYWKSYTLFYSTGGAETMEHGAWWLEAAHENETKTRCA